MKFKLGFTVVIALTGTVWSLTETPTTLDSTDRVIDKPDNLGTINEILVSPAETNDGSMERRLRRHIGSVASFDGFPRVAKISLFNNARRNGPQAMAKTSNQRYYSSAALKGKASLKKLKRRFIPVAALGNYYKEREHFIPQHHEAKSRALSKLIHLMSQVHPGIRTSRINVASPKKRNDEELPMGNNNEIPEWDPDY